MMETEKGERNLARWLTAEETDRDTKAELAALAKKPGKNRAELVDRFYKDLEFGTGGLRGLMGAGTNRVNLYTVRRATQGLCDYILLDRKALAPEGGASVVIGYDSRLNSRLFAEGTAGVLAANGIKACLFEKLCPVSAVSFAVRRYGATMGVMITASHNPAGYNGYKVYNAEGHQVTDVEAKAILKRINALDVFGDVSWLDFAAVRKTAYFESLGSETIDAFSDSVYGALPPTERSAAALADLKVAYSPLNGAGSAPVQTMLRRLGVGRVDVVRRQEKPDGNFPTCPYPNPEKAEALAEVLALAKEMRDDLVLATDPDCDRIGVAAKLQNGQYRQFSGNEIGVLMLDYLLRKRGQATEAQAARPVVIRTIVSSRLTDRIAAKYGAEVRTTLTGFKYIGEALAEMIAGGRAGDFVFAFEESCGYLPGAYVCEKDGVGAAALLCLMAAEAKSEGKTLADRLSELYGEFGYVENRLIEFEFDGAAAKQRSEAIMARFSALAERAANSAPDAAVCFADRRITAVRDYRKGLSGFPVSPVLEFELEDGLGFIVRPSGTEPKLKIYVSACGCDRAEAERLCGLLEETLRKEGRGDGENEQ